MRLLGICLLATLLLLVVNEANGKKHFKHSHNPGNANQQQGKNNDGKEEKRGSDDDDENAGFYGPRQIASAFGVSGREYRFRFDSQTTSGYASWISTQRAMSRFQALINVQFVSGNEAVMRLSECLAGQLNAKPVVDAWNPARIQPIEAFESNAKFQHEELERPVRFSYEQGAIEKIRFHPDEPAWSKNVKKAVLNMLQVQLAKDVVTAQRDPMEKKIERELRQQTGTIGGKAQPQISRGQERDSQYQLQKSFTLLEMTIEGECECTYSMVPMDAHLVNVTKSVNFDRCRVLADTAFGMQADEEGKQRGEQKQAMDEMRQHQEDRLATTGRSTDMNGDPEWRNRSAGPMIAQQILDRSTTIRYVLTNQQKQSGGKKNEDQPGLDLYGIQHVELVSQYSLKASEAQSSQALQTVAAAQLHFLGSSSTKGEGQKNRNDEEETTYEEEGESLMYNADMESQEKCFYMFGDDTSDDRQCPHQHGKNGETTPYPFNYPNSQVKVSRAAQLLQLVAQAQKQQGNAQKEEEKRAMNTAENLDELITIMRFCTEKELQAIQEKVAAEGSSSQSQQQFFADALAAAGTRNTLKMLLKRIEAGEFADLRAAQLMKIFSRGSGLPAPSDKIVDLVLALCKTGRVQQSAMLKQACWLSFGAILGELNQQQRIVRYSPVRTPVSQYETCPAHKMELYTKAILEQFKKTSEQQVHERVLALKAIGNAALDSVPKELADCIREKDEDAGGKRKGAKARMSHMVSRANAIEALRRIPSQKVQKLLLPVYLDQGETLLLRTTALSVLLQSQLSPSQPTLDQIAFAMSQEKCPQVLSFTQTILQELTRSPAKRHRKIAQHVKAALRLAGIDERQLEEKCRGAASKFNRAILFSQAEQTGAFIEFAKIFPNRNAGSPSHLWFSLTSLLNGQMTEEKMRLTICQQNLDRFFDEAVEEGRGREEGGEAPKDTQQQQQSSSSSQSAPSSPSGVFSTAKEHLSSIWSRLKGIARSNGDDEGETEEEEERRMSKHPALVASLRVNNIDTIMMVLIDGQQGPMEMLKQIMAMAGRVPTAAEYASGDEKPAMDVNGIMFWQDRSARIPTSTGLQLNIQQKSAIFGQIEANARQLGRAQFSLDFRPALTYSALQKMKCWTSPIHASGVKNLIAVEANLPMKAQLTIQPQQQQIKVAFRVPQSATRFFAIHSLPSTFVSETSTDVNNNGNGQQQQQQDDNSPSPSSPFSARYHYSERVRSVENKQLVGQQFGVDKTAYQSIGLPIHVQGILHRPRSLTKLKEWAKVLFASENHYHVDFEPQPGTSPREISLTFGWDLFKLHPNTPGATMQPKLRQFMDKFAAKGADLEQGEEPKNGEEEEEEEKAQSAAAEGRHYQVAQEMVKKYSQQKAYKHTMKCTLETVGGEQNKHVQMELESVCNGMRSACDHRLQVKCTTGGPNEAADWEAEGQVHALFPRPTFIEEEEDDFGNHPRENGPGEDMLQRQMFIGKAEVEWTAKGQPEKEYIRMNIKGTPSAEAVQLFREFIRDAQNRADGRSPPRSALPRNAARPFVNSYQAVAEYKLAPSTLGFFQRGMELVKAQNFFNFQSRHSPSTSNNNNNNQLQRRQVDEAEEMRAFITFDPVTQRHMNASIKTGGQQMFFQQVELPYPVRPMPLVRIVQQSASTSSPSVSSVRPAKSVKQILQQQIGQPLRNRAECRMDTRRQQIATFDGVQMAAPISKCWTLLAKHNCGRQGNDEDGAGQAPEFAVLIKSIPGSQQKKLKVVSAEMGIVVIEPREHEEEEEETEMEGQRNGNKLQVRIINNAGVRQKGTAITSDKPQSEIPEGIEFAHSMSGNGKETVIIESEQGHVQIRFNGQTARIKLSGSEYQNSQCGLCGNWDNDGANEWESLPNGGQAKSVGEYQRAYAMEDEEAEEQEGCTQRALDQFYAHQSAKFQQQGMGLKNKALDAAGEKEEEEGGEEIVVEQQTKVIEYQHQLCFSMRPVKQCPVGSYATTAANNGVAVLKQQKVPFTCLDRSSLEAKQFKRQARRGESIQLAADYPASFQEMVVIPERCIKY